MKQKIPLVCLLLCLFSGCASSAVTEFGNPSCVDWVKSNSPASKVWLLGYLSGINVTVASARNDPLDKMENAEEAFTWMDTYCRNNPAKTAGEAAQVFYAQLKMRIR